LLDQLREFPDRPALHLGGYGEPVFHPDFVEMAQRAKAVGLRVEVTTNGTLLTPQVVSALLDAELDRLVVSIDGASPETYGDIRRQGSLRRVIENLDELRRQKLRRNGRHGRPQIGIAVVAMKRNMAELAALPRLATRIGASEIIVSNLIPHTAGMEQEILYERSLTACAYRASRWVADVSLPKLDLTDGVLDTMGGLFASTASVSMLGSSLSARNNYCTFAQQGYAALRWDGEVSPCLPLLHDHPMYLRHRRRDITHYSLGNIGQKSLYDIWSSEAFSDFRARLRDFSFSPCTTCGGCERFSANYADCTEHLFPTCGGCLWAQGFVQCP
jgi:MoaA/NifB/PqqE/SkfB family radical SAM enzyme